MTTREFQSILNFFNKGRHNMYNKIEEDLSKETNLERKEWIIAKYYLNDMIDIKDSNMLALKYLGRPEF